MAARCPVADAPAAQAVAGGLTSGVVGSCEFGFGTAQHPDAEQLTA
jgi:hypothetical protein